MRTGLAILTVVLMACSFAQADIIAQECAADGDGAITCATDWNQTTYDLTITGDQVWAPAHIDGSFTTDTELDPTVTMINFIENDTAIAWTGYVLNIYMNKTFTIDSAVVLGPAGWSTSLTQPLATASANYDTHGNLWDYMGVIDMTGGTAVQNDGSVLSFQYVMSFLGSVSFEQEMIPVPEPATMALLGFGAVAALIRRRK